MARAPNPAKYFLVPYVAYEEGQFVSTNKAVIIKASSLEDAGDALDMETHEGDFPPELVVAMETDTFGGSSVERAGDGLYYVMGMPETEEEFEEGESPTFIVRYGDASVFSSREAAEDAALKDRIYSPLFYTVDRGGLREQKSRKNSGGRMRRSNAQPGERAYYRRNLILPPEVIEPLYSWHGGQYTGVYSLASTGDHDYVSQSMIDRAISELEADRRKVKSKKDKKDLGNLIGDLDMVSSSPSEFSTKEAGLGDEDSGYDEYGMRLDEVENPRARSR